MRFPSPSAHTLPGAACLLGLLVLLGWDASGLDLAAARWFGDTRGFALRDHWLFSTVLHQGGRAAAFALAGGLVLQLLRRTEDRARIAWLLVTAIGGMLLVSVLKHESLSSCPWDLQPFGGPAAHVSHWLWGRADGGPGHCFPAGHASAAFAWVAGWFAWRDLHPRRARAWLGVALVAGLALGLAQQVRGAHFTSHTLWSAWICWTWAWACTLLLPRGARHAAAAG
jgi:membrane-associated PAP2 superfamily phosphatase